MATSGKTNPAAIIGKINALEAGVTKDIVGKITVAGTAMTGAQINAELGTGAGLYAAVTAAKVAEKTALAAWEAALPGLQLFIKNLEIAIKSTFGVNNIQLLDFGINPLKKPAARTSAEKAVSAALAQQTRTLRGTIGKVQKSLVTTQGRPGLVLVSATGTPIPGGIVGPTPPGSNLPVDAGAALANDASSAGGSTPSGGGAAVPTPSSTPSGK